MFGSNSAAIFRSILSRRARSVHGIIFLDPNLSNGILGVAFIFTRPVGAVLVDLLDKPVANSGLELSRYAASAALVVAIAI